MGSGVSHFNVWAKSQDSAEGEESRLFKSILVTLALLCRMTFIFASSVPHHVEVVGKSAPREADDNITMQIISCLQLYPLLDRPER